jgi:hypothetical protein
MARQNIIHFLAQYRGIKGWVTIGSTPCKSHAGAERRAHAWQRINPSFEVRVVESDYLGR